MMTEIHPCIPGSVQHEAMTLQQAIEYALAGESI